MDGICEHYFLFGSRNGDKSADDDLVRLSSFQERFFATQNCAGIVYVYHVFQRGTDPILSGSKADGAVGYTLGNDNTRSNFSI